MQRGVLWMRRPADEHHLGHGEHAEVAAQLAALVASVPGGRAEAGLGVAVFPSLPEAVTAALRVAGMRGVAAAVGEGAVAFAGDSPVGAAVGRTRRLAELARVGEVLVLDAVPLALPAGIGVFEAPAALAALVGGPVSALRDYR